MNYLESPQVGSDKTAYSGSPENNGAKVDMTDRNITDFFRSNSQDSSALVGDQLHISNPYSQEDIERLTSGNQQNFARDAVTSGESPLKSGSQGYAMQCDTTSGATTDASSTATDATTASGSNSDAFIQQLSQTDPNLATMLTDAQQQMSPTGASQLEANVMANFNQNNGQFPTDSSLMNASIGQMDGQGVASSDIINAQNSVDADLANPNIGDAPVSTFSSSGSDSNGSSSSSGSDSSSSGFSSSSDGSGSSSCDNSGSSSSSSDSSNPEQQDISQLMQDLESGNIQQFLQDLINDLPTLLGSSGSSSGSDAGSTDGSSSGPSSDAPSTSSDGTTPTSPTTGSDAPSTTATTPGATATSLANVPNATAQITDTLSNGQEESLGSGYFVQGQNGTPYLITDDHVTVDPGTVTATLANGETVPITSAGTNPADDLAAYTSPDFNGVSTLALDPNLVSSGSAEAYVPLQQAGAGFYAGTLNGTAPRGSIQVTPDDSYEQGILNQENPNDTMIGFNAPLQAGSSGSPILVDTSQGWEVASMQDDGNGTSNYTTSSQDVQAFVNSLSA